MAQPVTLHSTLVQHGDLITQELEDDLLMANLESGKYYGVGSTAKRVWELLAQPTELEIVCDTLQEEYDVERSICEKEVLAFAARLLDKGIAKFA
jgi:hypothetical protein